MFSASDWEFIIENSVDGVFITDGEGNAVYTNKAYRRMSGLTKEEINGKHLQEFLDNKYISKAGTVQVLKTKKPITIEEVFYRTQIHGLATCNPILDKEGNIIAIVANVRDMSDIYRLKEELEHDKVQMERYKGEIDALRKNLENKEIIANDKVSLETLFTASRIAPTDSTVLITGESGVGKEEYAKFIYRSSQRRDKTFIKLNCSAIAENLVESELFGYEKGAFTGANKEGKAGLLEIADKGTLFLDEIGELPLHLQPKLLRVIQEGEFTRVGGVKPIHVDVRILAATNRDLAEMVREKKFREDLYYRLNVIPLKIAPLRERRADIRPLAEHFLQKLNRKYGFQKRISEITYEELWAYDWPGNIRELRNLIERAVIMSPDEEVQIPEVRASGDSKITRLEEEDFDLAEYLRKIEYDYMRRAYEKAGNVRDAAQMLKMKRSTYAGKFHEYQKKYEE